jgi:hypothetical protein
MTTSREYTNIYGQIVREYKKNGETIGRGIGNSSEAAKAAADADVQNRNNKK